MFLTEDRKYWVPFSDPPDGWQHVNNRGVEAYYYPLKRLYVISTMDLLDTKNGILKPCHHVSISRKGKPIKWQDIVFVKNIFMGEEIEAFHIIPKHSEYVNLHENCFHIWSWV